MMKGDRRQSQLVSTFLVLSVLCYCQNSHAAVLSSQDEQKLRELVARVMDCREIPGLTMTLVKGREYLTLPLGVANRETGEPVTSKTLFHIGSVTQSFTATLMAILQQRSGGPNGISFDTPITSLIGGEMKMSNNLLTTQMTLRDALMHRTGLSAGSIGALTGLPKTMSRKELVSHMKELPQLTGFRDLFNFNKFTFTLAAYVGEKLTGSSWEKLMRAHLLDKLLMSSTLVSVDDASGSDFSRSYVTVEDEMVEADQSLFDLGPLAPAGTMYTNADDMIKGLKFFLGDPALFSQVQMPAPVLEDLMAPRIILSPGYRAGLDRSSPNWPVADFNVGYAMGFFRNVYRGYQVPWHPSNQHGFSSIMWLIPERNIGVFISINGQKYTDHPVATLQTIVYYATDLMLEEEPWVNSTSACTFPEPWAEAKEFPEVDFSPQFPTSALGDYQGTYSNPLLGDITIRVSGTRNKALTFTMGSVVGELLPEGGHIFRLFLDGRHKYMKAAKKGKKPVPLTRFFFDVKESSREIIGLKIPESLFGGEPVNFVKTQGVKEEL